MSANASYPRVLAELRPYMSLPHPLPTHGPPASPDPTISVRAAFDALPRPSFDPRVQVEERKIDRVRTIIVRPPAAAEGEAERTRATIYVLHPGGFVFGRPEMEAMLLSSLALAGHTCISPDYRLAPEHAYPAAWEDVRTVWDWITSPSAALELGVEKEKIILMGTSAGSALASWLAFRLAEEKAAVMPRLVILDSPHLDSRIGPFKSMQSDWPPAVEGYMWWAAEGCKYTNIHLFGGDSPAAKDEGGPEGLFVNELPVARYEELASRLPAFYMLVCELDCLRDSALECARKLLDAGVRVDLRVEGGTVHYYSGFFPTTRVAQEAREAFIKAIQSALEEW